MPGGGAMARDPFFTEYPLAIIERLGAAQAAVGDKWSIEGLNAVTTLVPPLEELIAKYLHRVVFERGGDDIAPLKDLKAQYACSGKRDPAGRRPDRRPRQTTGPFPEGDGQPDAGVSWRHRGRHGTAAVDDSARPELEADGGRQSG